MSIHNIGFRAEIRKKLCGYLLSSGAMIDSNLYSIPIHVLQYIIHVENLP